MSLPDPLIRLSRNSSASPARSEERAASRLFILRTPREQTERLVDALRDVKERVTYCSVCNNITDVDPAVLQQRARDQQVICVVEEPQNVSAVEKTREFKGVYHVLGALSPLQGIGPDDLKIRAARACRRRRIRNHPGDQPQRRGRGDRDLPRALLAARRQGDAHRDGVPSAATSSTRMK
jgi:hypothetical protein